MLKKLLPSIIATALVSGCAVTTSRTVVEFDGSKTDYAKLDSMKTGKACMSTIMGIPTSMDSSIASAAKNGGISKIVHVDQVIDEGIFWISRDNCTVVYGK